MGIARAAVREAIDTLRDIVIVDTAGRLHVDQQMMEEAAAIKGAVQPEQVLMVVDAMTGQDAVNVAKAFAEQVDFDGVIMSRASARTRFPSSIPTAWPSASWARATWSHSSRPQSRPMTARSARPRQNAWPRPT